MLNSMYRWRDGRKGKEGKERKHIGQQGLQVLLRNHSIKQVDHGNCLTPSTDTRQVEADH